MADKLGAAELVFSSTYAQSAALTIRIPNAALQTLVSLETEPSAGSFDLCDDFEQANRFIIWRASGSTLFLEERSTEQALQGAALSLFFTGASIIPGTQIFLCGSLLIIAVPTQTSLHRFFVQFSASDSSLSKKSVLSVLGERCCHLAQCHDSYELTTQGCALSAYIALASDGNHAVFCLRDDRVVVVNMPRPPAASSDVQEVSLQGEGFLQRMMRSSSKPVASVASCLSGGQFTIFILFSDGHLHAFVNHKKEWSDNIANLVKIGTGISIKHLENAISMKIERHEGMLLTLYHLQRDGENIFAVSSPVPITSKNKRDVVTPTKLIWAPQGDIIDVVLLQRDPMLKLITLCRAADGKCAIMSANVSWDDGEKPLWETSAGPRTFSAELEGLLSKRVGPVPMKRARIFDPNNYSFDVVSRAVALVCKSTSSEASVSSLKFGDWTGLSNVVDIFIRSPQFDDQYVSRAERTPVMGSRVEGAGVAKLWNALERCCEELLEVECEPLAVWHSNSLGLYGTLQKGRFTVCVGEDEQLANLRSLLSRYGDVDDDKSVRAAFDRCARIAASFASSQLMPEALTAEQREEFAKSFPSAARLVEDLITKFAEYSPVYFPSPELEITKSSGESFLSGLVAASLRQRIDGRLRFSNFLIAFIEIVNTLREVLRITDARWETTLFTHERTVHNINRQYTVLSQALAIRVPDFGKCEASLGDAFFSNGGLALLEKSALAKDFLVENDDGDEEEVEDEDMQAEIDVAGKAHPGKSEFLSRMVSTAVVLLWPESTAMLLPKFLAFNRHYSALLEYCQLNEPYSAELLSTFRFFEGTAYTGLNLPEKALVAFLDAFEGVERGDDAIFGVFCSGKVPARRPSIEFFLKVMGILEERNFSEQVVSLGHLALKKVSPSDPLLGSLYTMQFKHELASGRYSECLRTLLMNPHLDTRKLCLRELLAKLIDSRKSAVLVGLNYGIMETHAVEILETRARSSESEVEAYLFELLFAFHFRRHSFRRAARVMYEYASRLQGQLQVREVMRRKCYALCTACGALSLLTPESQFITVHQSQETVKDVDESSVDYMTDENVSSGSGQLPSSSVQCVPGFRHPLVVRTLDDIKKLAVLSDSRYALLDDSTDKPTAPAIEIVDVLDQLIERRFFDRAWLLASTFDVAPYHIIAAVTRECIQHDSHPEKVEPIWIASNQKYQDKNIGGKDGCWLLLRAYIETARRSWPSDSRIIHAATEELLQHEWSIPYWLAALHEESDLGDYLNLLLTYGRLSDAFASLEKNVEAITNTVISNRAQTILPYTAIDHLFHLTEKSGDDSLKEPAKRLMEKLRVYFDRLESFSRA